MYFVVKNLLLQSLVAHIGSTTMREPEKIIEILAKTINKMDQKYNERLALNNCMKQFQARKFKLGTLFFDIDWRIVLGVSFIALCVETLIIIFCTIFSVNINNGYVSDYCVSLFN